jgi:cation:H+ antiporter
MTLSLIYFVTGLVVLLICADFFTRSAEVLGRWFGFSDFVVGVFIVGIGTSLPELISSGIAVSKGASEIVSGNIIGANTANLLLITGIVAAILKKGIDLGSRYIFVDLHFLIAAVFMLGIASLDGVITIYETGFSLLAFGVYCYYLIQSSRGANLETNETIDLPKKFPIKETGLLVLTAVGIYFGADYTVSGVQGIAEGLSIPPAIVSLTLLSLGTTLPELAVNISSVRKGNAEMALGNVLGSCVFNTLLIPFVANVFGPIVISGTVLNFSLPVLVGSVILFYLVSQDKKISRWEGLMFIILYFMITSKYIFT